MPPTTERSCRTKYGASMERHFVRVKSLEAVSEKARTRN